MKYLINLLILVPFLSCGVPGDTTSPDNQDGASSTDSSTIKSNPDVNSANSAEGGQLDEIAVNEIENIWNWGFEPPFSCGRKSFDTSTYWVNQIEPDANTVDELMDYTLSKHDYKQFMGSEQIETPFKPIYCVNKECLPLKNKPANEKNQYYIGDMTNLVDVIVDSDSVKMNVINGNYPGICSFSGSSFISTIPQNHYIGALMGGTGKTPAKGYLFRKWQYPEAEPYPYTIRQKIDYEYTDKKDGTFQLNIFREKVRLTKIPNQGFERKVDMYTFRIQGNIRKGDFQEHYLSPKSFEYEILEYFNEGIRSTTEPYGDPTEKVVKRSNNKESMEKLAARLPILFPVKVGFTSTTFTTGYIPLGHGNIRP